MPNNHDEQTIESDGLWAGTRQYRLYSEMILFSALYSGMLIVILSNWARDPKYVFLTIDPTYAVGFLSGGIGGCMNAMLSFWRRTDYKLGKKDYWRHAVPSHLGPLFGLVMVFLVRIAMRSIDPSKSMSEAMDLHLVSLVCVVSGLFTNKTIRLLRRVFDNPTL